MLLAIIKIMEKWLTDTQQNSSYQSDELNKSGLFRTKTKKKENHQYKAGQNTKKSQSEKELCPYNEP